MNQATLLALQRTMGNAAVTRMLQQARHEHLAGCDHEQADPAPEPRHSTTHEVLDTSGKPLDEPVRTEMEARLGADFSDVRLHTDSAGRRSAAEIGARAYTSGHHVVIGTGGDDKHTLAHELTHVIQQRQGPVDGTDHGNGVNLSDPSDRFERAAEANARRVMAAPVPHDGAPVSPPAEVDTHSEVQRASQATPTSSTSRWCASAGPRDEAVAIQRMGNCLSDSRGEEEVELSRTGRRAPGPGRGRERESERAGAARPPSARRVAASLAPHVGDVLRAIGRPLRELEMRMFAPEQVIMSIAFDPELGGQPLAEGYRWLTQNFTSICGETTNLLRETTFSADAPQRQCNTLEETVVELQRHEDANLIIRCGGHAFFVERRGGICRILQSFIGQYALTDSLEDASHAGRTTAIPATELAQRLHDIGAHHRQNRAQGRPFQPHPDEQHLFGGPLFSKKDIHDDHIVLHCECTTNIQTAQDQRRCIDERLARFATTWDQISTFQGIPSEWLNFET
ncbi:MAG: DUF4157 domain-containing protein [Sciscionella sp.]